VNQLSRVDLSHLASGHGRRDKRSASMHEFVTLAAVATMGIDSDNDMELESGGGASHGLLCSRALYSYILSYIFEGWLKSCHM